MLVLYLSSTQHLVILCMKTVLPKYFENLAIFRTCPKLLKIGKLRFPYKFPLNVILFYLFIINHVLGHVTCIHWQPFCQQ